ncbi:hypothetical protein JOQ06_001618, partial [Pogonophryne albipinna]
ITLPQSQSDLGSNRKTVADVLLYRSRLAYYTSSPLYIQSMVEPLYFPSTPLTRDEYPEGNTDYKQEVTPVSGL